MKLSPDTPVVLIILDELPTANLMTADGKRIDGRRFPNIADFASGATWYRDNVSAGDFTAWAVPPILTGNLSNEKILPTTVAQPENIYTLLGPGREIHDLEPLTELCPVSLCPDGQQGEAPDATTAVEFIKTKFEPFDPAEANEWIAGIPAGDNTLTVGHLTVPHQPLRFTTNGKVYPGGPLAVPTDLGVNGWTIGDAGVAFMQQRHLIQTGFADRLVGRVMRKIRSNGDFGRALIVLTADHGVSFDPDDLRRDVTPANVGATVNPPLIIKYPGQTEATVSATSTQSIDILPTIASQLGEEIPPTDGIPIDQARPDRVMTVSRDRMLRIDVTVEQIRSSRARALAAQYRRLGEGTLWRLGPRSGLIGRYTDGTPVHRSTRSSFDMPGRIRSADSSNQVVPSLTSGVLSGIGPGRVIALGWDGRIVATTRSFRFDGAVRFGAMVPPSMMHRGRNRVAVYLAGPGHSLWRIR